MFGQETFKPWVGKNYPSSSPRIMVLGESRYDEEFSDEDIVRRWIHEGQRTHTNFLQAILGRRRGEKDYDPTVFWDKTIFYNYNTEFFPGQARAALDFKRRMSVQNQTMLRRMLEHFKPTHCVVWGVGNWRSISVGGADWSPTFPLTTSGVDHEYRNIEVDGQLTAFSYVQHPSTGFSYDRWRRVLEAFLAVEDDSGPSHP